ncbi:MAG: OmpH family outer membrane protein [Rickettsiales bacterium]|jgi:Skp family chaperone for outer membrane proteins|nr:OmpH family outer membrane protein [Rickettsiales bacterium]
MVFLGLIFPSLLGARGGLCLSAPKREGAAAVVDVQKIAEGLREFRDLRTSLEEEKQTVEDQARREMLKLKEENDDLESKTGILSETALREKAKKLQEKYMKIQGEATARIADIQNRLTVAVLNLNDAIGAAAAEVAREKPEYSLVIESQATLYHSARDDITMEVLGKLAKKKLNLSDRPVARKTEDK